MNVSVRDEKNNKPFSAQQQPAIHGRSVLFPGVASGLMFTPAVRAMATAFLVSSRYGVFCRIKHKTRLGRKVHSWWREDIDEPRRALAHVLGGVNHSCRNDEDRRTFVVLMFVIAPARLVRCPGIAQVMDKRSFQAKRHLLEILMGMRAELALVAPCLPRHEDVDHEVGRPKYPHLERGRVGARDRVQVIVAQPKTPHRVRPRRDRRHFGRAIGVDCRVFRCNSKIGTSRRVHGALGAASEGPGESRSCPALARTFVQAL
jgi:hypothetical protein